MRVLVVYASADAAGSLDGVDAVVLGSAVHNRQWLGQATSFVNTNRQAVRDRPFWTFSVGMPDALPTAFRKIARTEEGAIIARLGDLRPRGHRLFSGVVKPSQFPLVSRIFLHLAGGRYGDFRDWPAIDRWALDIADQLDAAAANADGIKPRLDDPGIP